MRYCAPADHLLEEDGLFGASSKHYAPEVVKRQPWLLIVLVGGPGS